MAGQNPGFDPTLALRLHEELLAGLARDGLLRDRAIAEAFRATPRHHFLPGHALEAVYVDRAIAVKREGDEWLSSSSQPAMMAIMLAQLELQRGQRVLEIGAGTGYNAALLAHLVGPTGRVISIDLDDDLADAARRHLAAAGVTGVDVRQGDGAHGAPDAAPFDRIIVTVGAWDLLPAWREQIAPGGRIVLPMSVLPGLMYSLALEQHADGWEAVSARPCGFLPMRGAEATPSNAWGTPRILLRPHDRHGRGLTAAAIIDKEWCQIEVRWG